MLTLYRRQPRKALPLPLFSTRISAGFPSPADDYIEKPLDLNDLVVQHPLATFYVRVQGDSMQGAGIHTGDILVVDRAIAPTHGKIVIALLEGEFTVKQIHIKGGKMALLPANPAYAPLPIEEGSDFQVWGVVTYVIHRTP